jgi:Na+-transporting methylmalonyl-CoA/oxaloacetate decarboxylase gamma subunit
MNNESSSVCIATLPEYPGVLESLQFQFTGLIVVFIALGSIWGLLETTGWIFRRLSPPASAAPVAQTPAPPDMAPAVNGAATQEVTPEVMAVIAAAVHVMTDGSPHRIITVTPHDPAFDWAREGRRAIFASHKTH